MNNEKSKLFIIFGTIIVTCLVVIIGIAIYFGVSGDTPKTLQLSQTEQTIDLKIKGNKNSKIYHLPGCPNYNDIAERNTVWFKTREEAENKGFRMAKNC